MRINKEFYTVYIFLYLPRNLSVACSFTLTIDDTNPCRPYPPFTTDIWGKVNEVYFGQLIWQGYATINKLRRKII